MNDLSDIELAISACREIESKLSSTLGATGRGLHQKITSVEAGLPTDLEKDLRFVATMRNKVVHESFSLDASQRKRMIDISRGLDRSLSGLAASSRRDRLITGIRRGVAVSGGIVAAYSATRYAEPTTAAVIGLVVAVALWWMPIKK